MSAESLRAAATLLRQRSATSGVPTSQTMRSAVAQALADLLETTAIEHFDVDCGENCTTRTYPVERVAAAYLGEKA